MTTQPKAVTPEAQTPEYVDEWWMLRHRAKLEEARARATDIDLVMLGDSITQGWEDEAATLWQQYFVPRNAFNLGFSGDRTEQVLWRLQNGALEYLAHRLTVLLIGTNNTGHREDPPEDTAAGIKAILVELQRCAPDAKTLLLAVLPRGMRSDDPLRKINAAINEAIVDLADGQSIHFLDLGQHFIRSDGRLRIDLMPDELHLNLDGYQLWADHLLPRIDALLT